MRRPTSLALQPHEQAELYALRSIVVAMLKLMNDNNPDITKSIVRNVFSRTIVSHSSAVQPDEVRDLINRILDDAGVA